MPSNFKALVLLLLFIAPGFLFLRSYQYQRTEPSLFKQVVASIIASAAIHTLLLLVFGGSIYAYLKITGSSVLMSEFTKRIECYHASQFLGYFLIFVAYTVLSLLTGWFGGFLWELREDPTERLPLWWRLVIEPMPASFHDLTLRIRLRNGEEYVGILDQIRYIGDKDLMYEITLRNIYYARSVGPDATTWEKRELPNHRLSFMSSVMSIKMYWVNRLIFILINSIFPQGNFYHSTPNLEEDHEKVHCSVIHGGT